MATYLDRPHTRLVAGVNLACVLELSIQESVSDEMLASIVENSRQMMQIVSLDEDVETEEEFF